MYKSTDGGKNWNTLDTNLPFAVSLVLNPANPSVIYAATLKGGVFKSTDAGTNWGESNTGLRALGIQVLVGDPADFATVYAGGDEGLFKSIDGGANWNQRAAFQITCRRRDRLLNGVRRRRQAARVAPTSGKVRDSRRGWGLRH
jgi:photosystem II stability/assembly factor-like uncharacterized protein